MEHFAAAVSSLNDQFALWVATQKQQKPASLWSQGAVDYLRHAVMIRRDSAEKAQAAGMKCLSSLLGPHQGHLRPFRWVVSLLLDAGHLEVLHKLLQIGKQQEPQLCMMPLQHSKVTAHA